MGEFSLTGLTNNFASQVLEISIIIDLDANGIIQVQAEESRSGAQAKITINPQDRKFSHPPLKHSSFSFNPFQIEQHSMKFNDTWISLKVIQIFVLSLLRIDPSMIHYFWCVERRDREKNLSLICRFSWTVKPNIRRFISQIHVD